MNIKITGRAVVISSVPQKTLKDIEKYAPETLVMYDEDKNPVFAVSTGKTGGVTKYGITFDDVTPEGNACTTIVLPSTVATEDRRSFVEAEYSSVLSKLARMEAHIKAQAEDLADMIASVRANIEVI